MALGSSYDTKCPLFNTGNNGGVLFPFIMPVSESGAGMTDAIDLDGSVGCASMTGVFKAPFACRLVTTQLYAVMDTNGSKAAAATTEAICVLRYYAGTGTTAAGSLLATITCDGAGTVGTIWTPGAGTTERDIAAGGMLVCYLSTAASATTCANADGAAKPVIWLAVQNAP